jgi:hypothetical protein
LVKRYERKDTIKSTAELGGWKSAKKIGQHFTVRTAFREGYIPSGG